MVVTGETAGPAATRGVLHPGALGLALLMVLAVGTLAHASNGYIATAGVNLRADSLRTSRRLLTLAEGAELEPLGKHSDFTGMYLVATAAGDTGWMAGEYLLEAEPAAADSSRGFFAALARAFTCPVARGAVKSLKDDDVEEIVLTPRTATIGQLRALRAPELRPATSRANDVEKTVYRVTGRLTHWGEEADGDYHLVLASPRNAAVTIVLELPNPGCLRGAPEELVARIRDTRAKLEEGLGSPPRDVRRLSTPVRVTVEGVGLFDFGHSKGHSTNAFELHPLLRLHFD